MTQEYSAGRYYPGELLREDRMPHIWCPGCGMGSILHGFLNGLHQSGLPLDKVAIVSGIGCAGRVAGYVKLDSFHTTHGRAIPFATGLKLANPELKVIVFSGDGDLVSIGGNHFIHAARRNMDLTVILVNNFTYGMTGGQFGPTTPLDARTATSRYGSYEPTFNVPNLAEASGAVYIARWTALHLRQMEQSFTEALHKKGFSLVEVISPCPTLYGRMNRQPRGLDQMKYYQQNSIIQHGADTRTVGIELNGKITVGKFIDIERPAYTDIKTRVYEKAFAPKPAAPAKTTAEASSK
ncbi:MAG: 2-oxoacid:ferredoxin oxidoreductase subunit beta [Dehalococcoidales bacterium]|nr:2-oxoacid:ferredoxin oxidoreductase subunit beta [Dehalococcoidales bacterium]